MKGTLRRSIFSKKGRIQPWQLRFAALAIVLVAVLSGSGAAQTAAPQRPDEAFQEIEKKYPGLLTEFGQLIGKLQAEVQVPPTRNQNRLLPLLPESTIFYAAFPNFGEASHHAMTIFHEELKASPVLRSWWQQKDMVDVAPKLETGMERLYQLSQFLGDEIVISASMDGKEPRFVVLAEAKKPGFKDFVLSAAKELSGKPPQGLRIFDVSELGAAKESASGKDRQAKDDLVVLVRPDFVVAASDLATLQRMNARLEKNENGFASTAFGQRIEQAYQGGTTLLAAADLQQILKLVPAASQKPLESTGFADAKYLVWNHTGSGKEQMSDLELSFTGPRRGIASWLAAPGPLGSLDFVSPQAMFAAAGRLKNFAEIFDDVAALATSTNPNALAGLAQMEQGLQLNLRDDLLSRLQGELALEVDQFTPPTPVWKVILRVDDPQRLQAALAKLLATAPVQAEQTEQDGVMFHTLVIPSAQKPTEIAYAFFDNYWVVASSQKTLEQAIRLHRSGESLGKSQKFNDALPPGRLSEVSGVLYEDAMAVASLMLRQAAPQMADQLSQLGAGSAQAVVCAYGEERALRQISRTSGFDVAGVLIGAAIAIPNLLRARIAANEASAVASLRTINTAQVTYAATYPQRGYATNLARLGSSSAGPSAPSPLHAAIIGGALGDGSCAAGDWCTKDGFRFLVTATCKTQRCGNYVVMGTPVDVNTGSRSFCSTSDTVIRYKSGEPLSAAVTMAECKSWQPLQ